MAHVHPVHPIPDSDGQCHVEFGYKTANIGGLCYVLSKPIAPSTWSGGTFWDPKPLVAPPFFGYCPSKQPIVVKPTPTRDLALAGYVMGAQGGELKSKRYL